MIKTRCRTNVTNPVFLISSQKLELVYMYIVLSSFFFYKSLYLTSCQQVSKSLVKNNHMKNRYIYILTPWVQNVPPLGHYDIILWVLCTNIEICNTVVKRLIFIFNLEFTDPNNSYYVNFKQCNNGPHLFVIICSILKKVPRHIYVHALYESYFFI